MTPTSTRFPSKPHYQGLVAVFALLFTLAPVAQVFAANTPPTVNSPNVFTGASLPKVDASSGAFTLSAPLDLPPGRNNLQPALSLDYNSQRTQDSIVGYGWNLSIPYIQRLNKTGSQDLYNVNAVFTSSIDGELVPTALGISSAASSSIASSSLATGLVSYYSLNGNSADAVSGNNGVDTSVTYGAAAGKLNQGASIPSSGNVNILDKSSLDFTSAVTLNAWVDVQTASPSFDYFFGKNSANTWASGNGAQWLIGVNNSNTIIGAVNLVGKGIYPVAAPVPCRMQPAVGT